MASRFRCNGLACAFVFGLGGCLAVVVVSNSKVQQQFERNTVSGKKHIQEWQQISEELGTYEPLDRIVQKEGGRDSPEAVAAATAE